MNELKDVLGLYLPKETVAKFLPVLDKSVPILIDGIQGPTGKSTLCDKLNSLGYNAQELWEYAEEMATKKRERDDNFVGIVISLNKFAI